MSSNSRVQDDRDPRSYFNHELNLETDMLPPIELTALLANCVTEVLLLRITRKNVVFNIYGKIQEPNVAECEKSLPPTAVPSTLVWGSVAYTRCHT